MNDNNEGFWFWFSIVQAARKLRIEPECPSCFIWNVFRYWNIELISLDESWWDTSAFRYHQCCLFTHDINAFFYHINSDEHIFLLVFIHIKKESLWNQRFMNKQPFICQNSWRVQCSITEHHLLTVRWHCSPSYWNCSVWIY